MRHVQSRLIAGAYVPPEARDAVVLVVNADPAVAAADLTDPRVTSTRKLRSLPGRAPPAPPSAKVCRVKYSVCYSTRRDRQQLEYSAGG